MAFIIDEDEEIYNGIPDDYVFVNEYINTDDDDEILDLIIKQTVYRFFSPGFNIMTFIQNFNFIKKN